MKPIDLYDATEAFESLDTDGDGRIGISTLLTLFLGLGYQPVDTTVADLRKAAGGVEAVTRQQVIQVLSKFQRFPAGSYSRQDYLQSLFDLVLAEGADNDKEDGNNHNNDGASPSGWTAADLVRLSAEQQQQSLDDDDEGGGGSSNNTDVISERQAAVMLAHLSSSGSSSGVVTREDFAKFWSPPDP